MKKKSKRLWLYDLLICLLVIIMLVSGYKTVKIMYGYYQGTKTYTQVASLASADNKSNFNINWQELEKKSKDAKAWLYLKDSVINYPVVQGKDNDYYLYRLADGTWNVKGSLFIDYRIEHPFDQFLTVIYGHRMNDGSMFKTLLEYRDDPAYYASHKEFKLFTPSAKYRLKVIGALTIPADSDLYNPSKASADKKAYIDFIEKNNEIKDLKGKPIEVSNNQNLVMLSTCTYEFEDARLVIFGVMEKI